MSSSSTKKALLFLFLSLACCGQVQTAFADKATVLWTDGEVRIQAAGSETLEAISAGTTVPEGSRIATSENASCALGFEGPLAGSALTLKSETSAQIKNLGDSAQIDLEKGALFVKLAKLKKESQFVVSSPTATATARGTGWQQSLDRVEVFEGTVSLKNGAGQEAMLSEGQALDLGSDGSFGVPRPVFDSDRLSWEEYGRRAISSPYFNRVSADDILRIRETIDAKRKSAACGSLTAYVWDAAVASGSVVGASQINELKTALTQPPFMQSPAYVSRYLDPIQEIRPGDPVSASTLRLLSDAADQASC